MQTWILLTGVQAQIQIQRRRLTEFSLTQLPNEYMPYAGVVRKIYRSRRKSFFWKREVGRCRCDVADVKTQVEINFLQTPTTLILTFLFERQGSVDWCPRNATRSHEMSIVIHWGKIAMWVCPGPTLSHDMRLDHQKLWWNFDFACVLNSLRHTRVRHRKRFSSMSVRICP